MRVGDSESYPSGNRMREGTSAIGIQGYVKYTSPYTVKYI